MVYQVIFITLDRKEYLSYDFALVRNLDAVVKVSSALRVLRIFIVYE